MEYAAEKEAYRKQTEEMGLQRKVKRGDAWYPIRMGKSYYNSLNQLVVEVFRQGEDDEIEHNFEFGRPVAFFRIGATSKSEISSISGKSGISSISGKSEISSISGKSRKSGKPVTSPSIHYFPFTATVSYVEGDRMVVAVPDNGQLIDVQGAEDVGIQLFFDETSYKMMFEALDRVMRAKGRLAYLRDLFYTPGMKPRPSLSPQCTSLT